jgi:hypothetical protein
MDHFFYNKYQLGLWELQHDLLFRKIRPDNYNLLIDFAWEIGYQTAGEYCEKYQTKIPSELAVRLNISLQEIDEGIILPEYKVYSEYISNQRRILLYKDMILSKVDMERVHCHNYKQIRELFIAHETFHHIECHYKGLTSKKQKITTLKIGPLHVSSGIRALCEIAAHSFTKAMLQME